LERLRAKDRERSRKYRLAHPEKSRENSRQWAKANPEARRAIERRYRKAHPEVSAKAARRCQLKHPEVFAAQTRKRREQKRRLHEGFTQVDAERVLAQFGRKCVLCGSKTRLAIDHHLPLSAGYALFFGNAVVLCKVCNARKKDKLPMDFYTVGQLARIQLLLTEQEGWL
jgi:hypothetical protein